MRSKIAWSRDAFAAAWKVHQVWVICRIFSPCLSDLPDFLALSEYFCSDLVSISGSWIRRDCSSFLRDLPRLPRAWFPQRICNFCLKMQKNLWICLILQKNRWLKYRFFALFRRTFKHTQGLFHEHLHEHLHGAWFSRRVWTICRNIAWSLSYLPVFLVKSE